MVKYPIWTYRGEWASFDAFFDKYPSPIQVSEIKDRTREELTRKEGAWYGAPIANRLVHTNAALVTSKVLASAQRKLRKLIRTNCHYINGCEYHLDGKRLDSVTVSMGERYIDICDVKSVNSSWVSDDLMHLAEKLALPIPNKVEKRWVEQMKNYAEQSLEGLQDLTRRENLSVEWMWQEFRDTLKRVGYLKHLIRTPEYNYLREETTKSASAA